jgi:hypothetical protein
MLSGGIWTPFVPGIPAAEIVDLLEDNQGAVWVATPSELIKIDGLGVQAYPSPVPDTLTAVTEDVAGKIWVSTDGSGLLRLGADGTWGQVRNSGGFLFDKISDLSSDPAGYLWVATAGGEGTFQEVTQTWHLYDVSNGPPSTGADFLYRGSDGGVWFGSYYAGFFRFDGSSWELIPLQSDGGTGFAQAVTEDPRTGDIWVGTFWGGLHHYNGATWEYFGTAFGFPREEGVLALHVGKAGHVWVGTGAHGLGYFTPATLSYRFFPTLADTAWNKVNCIFEDDSIGAQAIWVGTDRGLRRLDLTDSTWTTLDSLGGEPLGVVRSILREYPSGDLWVMTGIHGILIQHSGTWQRLIGSPLPSNSLTKLIQASNGDMWVGTDDAGVARRSLGNWSVHTTDNGLINNKAADIEEDGRGGIWVSHGGVSRYSGGEWGRYFAGSNIVNSPDVFRARGGTLWFAHLNGVSRHEPDYVAPQTKFLTSPPPISGSTTQTAVWSIGFKESLDGATFSYSLDGAPWSGWSPETFWIDSTLADTQPGHPHVLAVRSRDAIGNVDTTSAVAAFDIDATPPTPILSTPSSAMIVNGTVAVSGAVDIAGTSADPRFRYARIRLYRISASSETPLSQDPALDSLPSVTTGHLASWDTKRIADDIYDMELAVTDSLGLTGATRMRLVVDNQFPQAQNTSPSTIVAASGGHVYTTDAELHLYFAPRAFPKDEAITISRVAAGALQDPAGAQRVGDAFRIDWQPEPLNPRKPAMMVRSLAGVQRPAGHFAFYSSSDGIAWKRSGGTLAGDSLQVPVSQPGIYAVFVDAASPVGDRFGPITFAPRVFSPTGGFSNQEVGIGFSLPRSAPTTIRVFSRSGRLVREILSAATLSAGSNLVRWDGRDEDGTIVRDGVYFVTVEALGQTMKETLAVVR